MAIELIPEIALYRMVKNILKFVKNDFANNTDKTKTMLYYLFNGMVLNEYDFYQGAQLMLLKPLTDRRLVDVTVGYNMERAEMPTIHIILPSEQLNSAPIGGNEGYHGYETLYNTIDNGNGTFTEIPQSMSPVFTVDSFVTYNLLLTSNNTLEVILLYNLLKYMCISLASTFELLGFQNCKFGGSDMLFDESLLPRQAFHRNFNITFQYENSVRDVNFTNLVKTFTYDPKILD